MTVADVLRRAHEVYTTKSLPKWPTWEGISEDEQCKAICDEFFEWTIASATRDIHGDHGEIAELYDLIVVAARRIAELEK